MFVGITNTPRDYAWGAPGAISHLFGTEPTTSPEAELWLGAHHGSPSRILEPRQVSGAADLAEWIARDPGAALGDDSSARLPFLLKILAAGSPLSLQAHPTAAQAVEGFARDEAAGIPLDASHRNYKDAFPKPELIYALSETFDALCGFRPAADIRRSISRLIELDAGDGSVDRGPLHRWLDALGDDESLRPVFEWLISRGEGVAELVERTVELARANPAEFRTVVTLADSYPGDPGIVISIMLHNVTLARGEALFLPAGNIHAYLAGVGVELMTASDNVLRGGLTPKHIDVDELLSVLDFAPVDVPYLRAQHPEPGVELFSPASGDFGLARLTGSGSYSLAGAAIAVCVSGTFELSGARSAASLGRGESAYITADERAVTVAGHGELFIASGR